MTQKANRSIKVTKSTHSFFQGVKQRLCISFRKQLPREDLFFVPYATLNLLWLYSMMSRSSEWLWSMNSNPTSKQISFHSLLLLKRNLMMPKWLWYPRGRGRELLSKLLPFFTIKIFQKRQKTLEANKVSEIILIWSETVFSYQVFGIYYS